MSTAAASRSGTTAISRPPSFRTLTFDEVDYTLTQAADGSLSVSVAGGTPTPPEPTPGDTLFFAGDFNGDLFDTLAVQKDSTVTIYQNCRPALKDQFEEYQKSYQKLFYV